MSHGKVSRETFAFQEARILQHQRTRTNRSDRLVRRYKSRGQFGRTPISPQLGYRRAPRNEEKIEGLGGHVGQHRVGMENDPVAAGYMDAFSHRSRDDLGPGPAEHIHRRDQLQLLDAIGHKTEHAFGHENNLTQRQALATDSCARVSKETMPRLNETP